MALEVLRNDNYPPKPEDDVVEFEAWREKNDAALDAILSSCGTDILSQIKRISSPKCLVFIGGTVGQPSQQIHTVVDQLGSSSNISVSKQVRPALTGNTQRLGEQGNSPNNTGRADGKNQDYLKYASFLKAVRNGDLDAMKAFLALHPEASSAKLTFGDQTALHIAVLAGHVHIVEELVERIMSNETLEMQDVEGYTALARATSSGDFRMIQCMIDKNPKLVSIPEKSVGSIPVVISMCFDYKELSRYLYLRTPLMDLEPEKGHHGASLISFAIYTLTLGIHIRPSRATDEIRVNIQNLQEKTTRTSARALFQQLDPNLLSAIFRAIKEGNFEFVYEIVRANPDLLYVIEFQQKELYLCSLSYIVKQKFLASSTGYSRLKLHYLVLTQVTTIYYTWLGYLQCPLQFNISQVQLCKCKENFSGLSFLRGNFKTTLQQL
ncbi:hypothetical protein CJ030_MR1G020815 [Morella rubra]|uniref:Uncharacterized protein n=1 Tax=Morella rubra TaxID=262757 RepID=A0A6A1WS39_9ROSI|nr:hypothetical protein CJ030_MR1G020815 [Morella rubra]